MLRSLSQVSWILTVLVFHFHFWIYLFPPLLSYSVGAVWHGLRSNSVLFHYQKGTRWSGQHNSKLNPLEMVMNSENLIFFPLNSLPYKFQFTLKVITHRKLLILKLITGMSVVYHLWFDYPKHKAEFFQLGGFSAVWAFKEGWILGKKLCTQM